jgi:hypothetical protein
MINAMAVSNKPRKAGHNPCLFFMRRLDGWTAGRTDDAGHAAIAAQRRLEGPHHGRNRKAVRGQHRHSLCILARLRKHCRNTRHPQSQGVDNNV